MFSSKVSPKNRQARVWRISRIAAPPPEGIELNKYKLIQLLCTEMYTTEDNAYRDVCRRYIGDLGTHNQLVVMSDELTGDDASKLEQETLRSVRVSDEPPGLVPAQQLMNLLQAELDASEVDDEYRMTCMKCFRVVGKQYDIVPTSFFCRNVRRDGSFRISGGEFADIGKGTMEERPVFLKILRVYSTDSAKGKRFQNLYREALVWRQLRHRNVLPFLGVSTTLCAPHVCLIWPWMENGNIASFLQRNPSHDRLNAVCEIAQGIRYLHELDPKIVHGGIRGANILVNDESHCCLTNVGLTTAIAESLGSYETGPIRWLSPEMMDDSLFDPLHVEASDIYSFGCTIIEIYTGKAPFGHIRTDVQVIHEVVISRRMPPRPSLDVLPSKELWTLIESCLSSSPKDRPNALTILEQLRAMRGLCSSCPDDYPGPCVCQGVISTPSAIIVNEPLVGSSTLRQPSSTRARAPGARNLVPTNTHSPDSLNISRRRLSGFANRLQAKGPRRPSTAGGRTSSEDNVTPIPASKSVTVPIGASPCPEAPLVAARPIFPLHVRKHLLDHQDHIYTIFDRKVGLSADRVLLTAAFDEESLRSNNGSLTECAHIFCDTDFAVEDSTDMSAKFLLDVQKQVWPHSVIVQTPNYKFRICSDKPDPASGTSNTVVSLCRTTSSNTCPDRRRDPDGNPEDRAPTDTPRLPDPNQCLAVAKTSPNLEMPTGSSGRPGATPEADSGPPIESPEESHRAVFKIAFKFNKGNPLPFEQSVLVSGSVGTKDAPNSPMLPDVISSSRVEFFELDFQSTSGGAQGPNFCYHQFRSSVDIQISKDHPIMLSDKRPLPSQSSVDGQFKAVEATEVTRAMQRGVILTLGTQPAVAFNGMNTTTDRTARTNEYIRTLMRVQQVEINRRGIEWRYEIGDRDLRLGGLRLTPTPTLLPLVQFAFCGKQGALSAPTQLDVTVRSFWKLPVGLCSKEPNRRWIEEIIFRFFKRKREIPIQNFGLDVLLKLPTHLTTGSFINKDVIIGSDRVDSSRWTQSVTDFYSAGDLEVTPLAYTR